MFFGGPDFVLVIIGMAIFAGVLKTAIRARHGLPDYPGGRRGRRQKLAGVQDTNTRLVEDLRGENRRLAGRVEAMEDRLIVLEKIVTDSGYGLANEIESLRDRRPAECLEDRSN